MIIKVSDRWLEPNKEELDTLIELLQVTPVCLRYSAYQGVELVLEWNPNYRCITVVGLGYKGQILCYSKAPFKGAIEELGDWVLQL